MGSGRRGHAAASLGAPSTGFKSISVPGSPTTHPCPGKLFLQGPATHQQSSQEGLGSRQLGCGKEERLGELMSPHSALPLVPPMTHTGLRAESSSAATALA